MRIHVSLMLVCALLGCGSASPQPRGEAPVPVTASASASVAPTATASASASASAVPVAEVLPENVPLPGTADRAKAVEWIVGLMSKHAPPGRQTFYVEAQETKEDALVRYDGIANAIIDVVYDPKTKVLFKGANGRSRTVTVILGVMLFESGFMKNVDFGVGKLGIGDSGNSWCMLQLNVGATGGRTLKWNLKEDRLPRWEDDPADIFNGNSGPELVADRHICVREGLKALRVSFSACSGLPLDQALRTYGSGNCEGAQEPSAIRMRAAIRFWDETGKDRGFTDQALVDYMTAAPPWVQTMPLPPAVTTPPEPPKTPTPVETPATPNSVTPPIDRDETPRSIAVTP